MERILRSGKEMIERLLLDGIDGDGGGAAVAELHEASGVILADEAEAVLAFADVTVTRTEVAVQTAVGHGSPTSGLREEVKSWQLPTRYCSAE